MKGYGFMVDHLGAQLLGNIFALANVDNRTKIVTFDEL